MTATEKQRHGGGARRKGEAAKRQESKKLGINREKPHARANDDLSDLDDYSDNDSLRKR